MIFTGLLTLYTLENVAEKGLMPKNKLVKISEEYYGIRTVGVTRYYAALGANQSIDWLVRIWRNTEIKAGDYAVLEDETQYRIDFIQHLTDEDGLAVTDLTLVRLSNNYDIDEDTDNAEQDEGTL